MGLGWFIESLLFGGRESGRRPAGLPGSRSFPRRNMSKYDYVERAPSGGWLMEVRKGAVP